MPVNTIVAASDEAYAWGVWLLIASMRKSNMTDPVLIGTYNWSQSWLEDIEKFPGVKTVALPADDKRCVTCSKPEIMLRADTEIITWVDCDGFFTGNCSEGLSGEPDRIYIRPRTPSEIQELYRRSRTAGENQNSIPETILEVWRKDVGELESPRYPFSASAGVISVHRRFQPFLGKWKQQMLEVLPDNVGVVNDRSLAYFQTDDSVLNSLLLFAADAPPITEKYVADKPDLPHYVHFGYQPKPWTMWNRHSLRHFDATIDIVEWAEANGYTPRAPMPYTFKRQNKRLCGFLASFARNINRWRKFKRKYLSR